jgi:hypothetical protein
MEKPETYSLPEAERALAMAANQHAWDLLGREARTVEEDEAMVLAASASLYHWQRVGTGLHAQRGHWLLSHVYAVLEEPAQAMRHAERCLALTEQHRAEMHDFDIAYAYEALARANALQGSMDVARVYHQRAAEAGEKIADAEDRQIFLGDFEGGDWYGVA